MACKTYPGLGSLTLTMMEVAANFGSVTLFFLGSGLNLKVDQD